jgi:hypothetical protein
MATNLSIDPKLIDSELKLSGEKTKRAAVTRALEEFIARRRQKRVLDLLGQLEWDENFRPQGGTVATVNLFVDTSVWSLRWAAMPRRMGPRSNVWSRHCGAESRSTPPD